MLLCGYSGLSNWQRYCTPSLRATKIQAITNAQVAVHGRHGATSWHNIACVCSTKHEETLRLFQAL